MQPIKKKSIDQLGKNFIPEEYLPSGKDEFYLRELQRDQSIEYRPLKADEIEVLVRNENRAEDWNTIYVTNKFNPELVCNCTFHGLIRIGDLDPIFLEHNDMRMPVGLYDSHVISCEIGSNVVIKNVSYLANYIIGDNAILINIDEMLTTNRAKFGNGILKEGEDESKRLSIELGNENGKREVYPFDGMLSADCFLWYKYRDDKELLNKLLELTDKKVSDQRGFYGIIGARTIIKNCRVLKDVKTGSDAYIKGANKLKNLTINSSSEAHTQIGEGVELVNGIIGYGCRLFYGVKAVRFIIGNHSQLKYGARLLNSYLGENSTISCCEVLNSLIFPGHEQHHNNSFLCAATILGQSNIAAGATVGSNHNSRGADGEIVAGRGFWPGLCTNFKHFSKFASFCLVSKGTYHSELNITLPFALISNDEVNDSLQIMPAYWFLYNMYAMARNPHKFRARDKRIDKQLLLEFDYLAPDTVEEMLIALVDLENWTAKAFIKSDNKNLLNMKKQLLIKFDIGNNEKSLEKLSLLGKHIIVQENITKLLVIEPEKQEASSRPKQVLKVTEAYNAYKEMILFYGVRELLGYIEDNSASFDIKNFKQLFEHRKIKKWINIGGQLIPEFRLNKIKAEIKEQTIGSWDEVHHGWKECAKEYRSDRQFHGILSLIQADLFSLSSLTTFTIRKLIDNFKIVSEKIYTNTLLSREKDYKNPYRNITFDSDEERDAVLGLLEDNTFIQTSKNESNSYNNWADEVFLLIKKEI